MKIFILITPPIVAGVRLENLRVNSIQSAPPQTGSCPADFIPDPMQNAIAFTRKGTRGKLVTVYRCNRGFVISNKSLRTADPREMEVECSGGPTGGFTAHPIGSCVPGFCEVGPLRSIENGTLSGADSVIPIDTSISIVCREGHTIDGLPSGPKSRDIRCDQDIRLVPLYEPIEENDCQPVNCGELRIPDNTHIVSNHTERSKVKYGDTVVYECDEGFRFRPYSILSPPPPNPLRFSMRCNDTGLMVSVDDPSSTGTGKCMPAKCPTPPSYANADLVARITDQVSVGDSLQYVCQQGTGFVNGSTSSTGKPLFPAKTQFRISCFWDKAEAIAVYDTDPSIAGCLS
jgi:hypothetical protein